MANSKIRTPSHGVDRAGKAFVYLGSDTGLSSAVWSASNDQSRAQFGRWVASAGDVNGDGFADVLIGSPEYDAPTNAAGAAYLYLGANAPSGVCDPEAAPCDDSNPCTADDACTAAGVCVGDIVTDGTSCDNGDPCTEGDSCQAGTCQSGAFVCQDAGPPDAGSASDAGAADAGPGGSSDDAGCGCRSAANHHAGLPLLWLLWLVLLARKTRRRARGRRRRSKASRDCR